VSEYALVGARQAKNGTLLGAFSEAGFLIGLETNMLDCTHLYISIITLQDINYCSHEAYRVLVLKVLWCSSQEACFVDLDSA
jgi:hypothetical protein